MELIVNLILITAYRNFNKLLIKRGKLLWKKSH